MKSDDVLDDVRRELNNCLVDWTAEFEVKQTPTQYKVPPCWYAHNGSEVYEMLSELVAFETHADLAVAHVQRIANHENDPIRAAWLLEIAWHQDFMAKPVIGQPTNIKHQQIQALLTDRKLLVSASKVILQEDLAADLTLDYWEKVFKSLAL